MNRMPYLFFLFLTVRIAASWPASDIRSFRQENETQILNEFAQLLSIPNVASDRENILKNAQFILQSMERRGIRGRLLESNDGPPAIYGEYPVAGATRTLLLYAHYDGQPVNPDHWTVTPPWEPILRTPDGNKIPLPFSTAEKIKIDPESRIYARSASDDKAGVIAILNAFEAIRTQGKNFTSNIKIFFEGEEEAGSPHLNEVTTQYPNLLKADAWIFCDGPVHQSGLKQIVFGVRGDTNVDLTVYGARRPLHSGHYGNWAPNPAMMLSRLLASMKDEPGMVTIEGWYDDVKPLSDSEKKAIARVPEYETELKKELGIVRTEGSGKSLIDLINLPSLNINGMSSADVGPRSRNVIPTTATAALDLRLVAGTDYERQVERLIRHVRKQGYYVTTKDPSDEERWQHPKIAKIVHRSGGYNAHRVSMDLPISQDVIAAVQSTTAEKVVSMPTLGGSLPLWVITKNLNTPTIIVPIANYDNNQHAEDENIRIQNLWDGIETMAAIMLMKPRQNVEN